MAGDSGGREQNFWPGFVDALSNVVLVMIFVVVVFVVTLFYYSQKLAQFKAKKLVERVEQNDVVAPAKTPSLSPSSSPAAPDESKQIAALKVQVATLQAQLATAASANPAAISGSMSSEAPAINKVIEVKQADKKATDPQPGVKIDKTAEAITLVFDKEGVELTPEANKAMDVNLDRWTAALKAGQAKLIITGVVTNLSYSDGKRRAYYRAIAVRNHLLDLGVPASSLVTRVVPGAESSSTDGRVIVQYATNSAAAAAAAPAAAKP